MPGYKHPCQYCGNMVPPDSNACPFCGKVNPIGPLRCPTCRAPISEGMEVMHILRIGTRDHVPEVREKDILRLLL
jgi:predicted amidophosphoribosyltransferase